MKKMIKSIHWIYVGFLLGAAFMNYLSENTENKENNNEH